MDTRSTAAEATEPAVLNLFCSRGPDGFRVHVVPSRLPEYLRPCFDDGQAYPVELDLEELDRQMNANGLQYENRMSTVGGVELTGRGRAAAVLAEWLSSMLASGVRPLASPARASGD